MIPDYSELYAEANRFERFFSAEKNLLGGVVFPETSMRIMSNLYMPLILRIKKIPLFSIATPATTVPDVLGFFRIYKKISLNPKFFLKYRSEPGSDFFIKSPLVQQWEKILEKIGGKKILVIDCRSNRQIVKNDTLHLLRGSFIVAAAKKGNLRSIQFLDQQKNRFLFFSAIEESTPLFTKNAFGLSPKIIRVSKKNLSLLRVSKLFHRESKKLGKFAGIPFFAEKKERALELEKLGRKKIPAEEKIVRLQEVISKITAKEIMLSLRFAARRRGLLFDSSDPNEPFNAIRKKHRNLVRGIRFLTEKYLALRKKAASCRKATRSHHFLRRHSPLFKPLLDYNDSSELICRMEKKYSLSYNPTFKNLVQKNSGVLLKAFQTMKKAIRKPFSKKTIADPHGKFFLTRDSTGSSKGEGNVGLWRADVGFHSFHVKVMAAQKFGRIIKKARIIEEYLKARKNRFGRYKIFLISPYVVYEEQNYTFLATRFYSSDHVQQVFDISRSDPEYSRIKKVLSRIRLELERKNANAIGTDFYFDITKRNAFFDSRNRTILLYDL